ncbi:MAG: hypothetical protein ACQEWV_30485 [Bacillota bacterium]
MKKTIQDLIDETKAEIQYIKKDLCDWRTGEITPKIKVLGGEKKMLISN